MRRTMLWVSGKAGTEPGAGWPPHHALQQAPGAGQPAPAQPKGMGTFPSLMGTRGGGTQSPQQHPRPRGGGVLFPEQGEGGRGRRREEVMQIPAQLKEDDFISFSSPGAIYSHFNLLPFALLSLQQAVSPQTAGCLYSPCSTEFCKKKKNTKPTHHQKKPTPKWGREAGKGSRALGAGASLSCGIGFWRK